MCIYLYYYFFSSFLVYKTNIQKHFILTKRQFIRLRIAFFGLWVRVKLQNGTVQEWEFPDCLKWNFKSSVGLRDREERKHFERYKPEWKAKWWFDSGGWMGASGVYPSLMEDFSPFSGHVHAKCHEVLGKTSRRFEKICTKKIRICTKTIFFCTKKQAYLPDFPPYSLRPLKKERHVFPETQLYLPFSLYKK